MVTGTQTPQSRDELLSRARDIKTATVAFYEEIERIGQQENPAIEADYAVKIGVWKKKQLESLIAARRAKRRFELAQMRVNVGESVDERTIERQLDQELEQWRQALAQAAQRLERAMDYRLATESMRPADAAQLRRLFRKLARRLHPDLYPGDEQREHYYLEAVRAYSRGDVEALRAIDLMTEDLDDPDRLDTLSDEELLWEIDMLERRRAKAAEQLDELRRKPPYTLRTRLADEQWVADQVNGIRAAITRNEQASAAYEERYARLMASSSGPKEHRVDSEGGDADE